MTWLQLLQVEASKSSPTTKMPVRPPAPVTRMFFAKANDSKAEKMAATQKQRPKNSADAGFNCLLRLLAIPLFLKMLDICAAREGVRLKFWRLLDTAKQNCWCMLMLLRGNPFAFCEKKSCKLCLSKGYLGRIFPVLFDYWKLRIGPWKRYRWRFSSFPRCSQLVFQ